MFTTGWQEVVFAISTQDLAWNIREVGTLPADFYALTSVTLLIDDA